ncbi:antibiotic biosynthesis monooxygenase [Buttiauxella brennerae ATCC 51605]|uniref:Antibiotic biosynthesis monooxygenase n=1 Tax=Buttiauxella brennerae ATCC 51605 TaxID=1354251 RepID=A0A1B7IV67_9ENTR|nr:antibiotic biosynthesis monooxygenase [Buttiauxella brennerae]OAT33787.1 antibiotic biosynthesis monooxygenase [Buttiauxella brennerae ATCC 51605]
MPDNNTVTLVITHAIKSGQAARYEQWLERIMPTAARYPGHLGVHVIRPTTGNDVYNIVIRFDTLENLTAWTKSAEREVLVDEIKPILSQDDHLEVRTESAFWFTPETPTIKRPAKWKQFLITLAVIFPSTNIIPPVTAVLFPSLKGSLGLNFINVALVVALVVWLWMPIMTRLFAGWLKK